MVQSPLYTANQVRQFDQRAIEQQGIPGIQLMKRAGRSAFELLLENWPEPELITIFCGTGNNAGDGYVVAGLAAAKQLPVRVVQVGDVSKLSGDAERALRFAEATDVTFVPFSECLELDSGVIVDALLGTGLTGAPREPFALAIQLVNNSDLPILALDIPSGLCADTGSELGEAVYADATITFVALKAGLYTGRGVGLAGEVFLDDLGVDSELLEDNSPVAHILDAGDWITQLPPRALDSHKGDFGHVMVIGGDLGMGGAAALAGEAALRTGAGMVSVATRPEHVPAILGRRPELMVQGVVSGQELEPLLARPTVLVVGPGLGQSPWSEQLLQQALNSGLPLVLDADALNLLAKGRLKVSGNERTVVITPHPGEAARLLGCTTEEVQNNRLSAVRKLQQQFGVIAVLKGAGSLIAGPQSELISLCADGNPGMASGGMGDALSGVLGSLLAQQLLPEEATKLGVCIHSVAADLAAASHGERGLLASDLMPYLQELSNGG